MAHIEYLKGLDEVGYIEHANSRAGYIGPIRIPLKAALKLIDWEVRISHAWKRTFRPHLLHPQELTGYEGEPPYYLRADLARTQNDVVEYWLDQWIGARPADPKEDLALLREYMDPMEPYQNIATVWMIESTDPTKDPMYEDDACWYAEVTHNTPGAVAYWKWAEA